YCITLAAYNEVSESPHTEPVCSRTHPLPACGTAPGKFAVGKPVRVGESVSYHFNTARSTGIQRLHAVLHWGDANLSSATLGPSQRRTVSHRYKGVGTYRPDVVLTGTLRSGRKCTSKAPLGVISVKPERKRYEQNIWA